jgi:hypothetical protein
MAASRAAMTAATENANLVDKIIFLQWLIFTNSCKYTLTIIKHRFMKIIWIVLMLPLLNIAECGKHKHKVPAGEESTGSTDSTGKKGVIPSCLQLKIDSIKNQTRWNPPAQVDEYIYNGEHVFLFTADCCDQFNMLYDGQCNKICAPSGGFTGRGDMKCSDFDKTAQHVRLVWKDPR